MGVKFSELDEAAELAGSDLFAVSQKTASGGWVSRKLPADKVKTLISPSDSGTKSQVTGGNWSSSYPDNLKAANAHGTKGVSEYWKTTLELSKAAKDQRPPVHCALQAVPCNASGELLPYSLNLQYVSSSTVPKIIMILVIYGKATQALDLTSGVYSPLGVVNGVAYEPKYSLTYWY
ncbi:hypothetical protein HP437_22320 [Serratia marcescens]|uniref:hypothetical protein n=1 Tax=Serratia marcescens TaxID=615 RepID=UPI0015D926A9|nr:hypothetical protein [Serratia marcescens]QLJ67752.1 hypothetical protein HP437_22320 [Serratia marcescens]